MDKSSVKDYYSDWTEVVHDQKTANTLQSSIGLGRGRCEHCNEWYGKHKPDCPKVDVPSLAKLLQTTRESERRAKEKAARLLNSMQTLSNKVSALKWENNKLRNANVKLKSQRDTKEPS